MAYPTPEEVVDQLEPLLAKLGYTKRARVKLNNGASFSTRFYNPTAEELTSKPQCELFHNDAYPDSRGEVVLHVWNWIGMSGPVKQVAERLTALGLPARTTKNKGCRVVKVKVLKD